MGRCWWGGFVRLGIGRGVEVGVGEDGAASL